jgi:hypothetical protein
MKAVREMEAKKRRREKGVKGEQCWYPPGELGDLGRRALRLPLVPPASIQAVRERAKQRKRAKEREKDREKGRGNGATYAAICCGVRLARPLWSTLCPRDWKALGCAVREVLPSAILNTQRERERETEREREVASVCVCVREREGGREREVVR